MGSLVKIGIITIGNELLSGFTIDRNSAWIGQRLLEIGLKVHVKKTIADDADMITKSLDELSQDCNHIIITGGLGPTLDDITVKTLSEYFGDSPVFDEEYWKELEKRFKAINMKVPTLNRNQAHKGDKVKMIVVDTDHTGEQEIEFMKFLIAKDWKGIMCFDDIHLNRAMIDFWECFDEDIREDVTKLGHGVFNMESPDKTCGTGFVEIDLE